MPTIGNEPDCFHVLQSPRPPSPDDPFVGNESADDNLAECVQVAVWNAAHGKCHELSVAAVQGHVTLSGAVETAQHIQDCEAAVRALPGVAQVVNNLVSRRQPEKR